MVTARPTAGPRVDRPMLGVALRLGYASAGALMSALLKLASTRGVAASEMLFYRSVFGMPVVLLWLLAGPGIGAVRTRRPLAHLGRSLLGVTAISASFKALTMLPLADAATIGFMAPLFATILSAAVLAEPVGWPRWAAVAAGFAGMLIVVRPGGGAALPPAGLAIALLSALGTAAVTITIRQIGRTEATAAIVFWFFICSMVVGGALLLWAGRAHPPVVYALLAGAGVLGGIMQLCMTASLRFAPVALVAPFDYVQLVWMIALGWLLFAAPPTAATLSGAAVIAASGLTTIWREQRRHAGTIPATPPGE